MLQISQRMLFFLPMYCLVLALGQVDILLHEQVITAMQLGGN